ACLVDILERLADLIRPAINYRPGVTPGDPPPGAADDDGFIVTVAMTSLAGCAAESFASILHALGYQPERRSGPAISKPAPRGAENLADAGRGQALAADDAAANASPQAEESPRQPEPAAVLGLPDVPADTSTHLPAETDGAIAANDISKEADPGGGGATPDQAKEDGSHAGGEVAPGGFS